MSRYIIGGIIGYGIKSYQIGTHLDDIGKLSLLPKYLEYYAPEVLNPRVEKCRETYVCDKDWRDENEARILRNKQYYDSLFDKKE